MEIQNFKMRVTPEQSRIVQQTLFNNGYKKYYGDEIYNPTEPQTFIYLNKDKAFTANNIDIIYFNYNILPELTFQEFFDRYVKWCVKVTEENREVIYQWKLNNTEFSSYTKPNYCVFSDGTWSAGVPDGIIELTFEQFEKYVLKSKESKDMKKIIGYKTPFDLFNGEVKAGFIYKPLASKNNKYYAPVNFEGRVGLSHLNLPKEIVEQWEPVYEETSKELYFGKVKFTIKKGDNFATTEYGKVTKEEISKVFEYFNNPPALVCGKYQLKLDLHNDYEIKFGCQSGTLGELRAIYNAFD